MVEFSNTNIIDNEVKRILTQGFHCSEPITKIGKGAFASVYLTYVNLLPNAVKVIHRNSNEIKRHYKNRPELLKEEIFNERNVLEELKSCPNIITAYNVQATPEFYFIFFEYCNCETLNELIRLGNLPDNVLQYILI